MRPPNPRLSDNGNGGSDVVTLFALGIDPEADADPVGNWVRNPVHTAQRLAIVTPAFANGEDGNGSDLSLTLFQVMLFGWDDPGVKAQDVIGWRGKTLTAQGDSVRAAGGCWAFQAIEVGPDPSTTGLPDGA
jgi:hypothetical protein